MAAWTIVPRSHRGFVAENTDNSLHQSRPAWGSSLSGNCPSNHLQAHVFYLTAYSYFSDKWQDFWQQPPSLHHDSPLEEQSYSTDRILLKTLCIFEKVAQAALNLALPNFWVNRSLCTLFSFNQHLFRSRAPWRLDTEWRSRTAGPVASCTACLQGNSSYVICSPSSPFRL